MLYYCNTVRWAWLDWGLSGWLTTLLQCFRHCWFCHQTCKNRWPYNLYCVGADVKPCSINQSCDRAKVIAFDRMSQQARPWVSMVDTTPRPGWVQSPTPRTFHTCYLRCSCWPSSTKFCNSNDHSQALHAFHELMSPTHPIAIVCDVPSVNGLFNIVLV